MEYWGPVVQTILWVSLVVFLACRFHKPIIDLLEALTERIRSGSDVTAGPFSVKTIKSLSLPQQVARVSKEIEVANTVTNLPPLPAQVETNASAQSPTPTPTQTPPTPTPQLRAQYFQAEDLALRALQAEVGKPIRRQVLVNNNLAFDGAFLHNNRMNLVEVKYFSKVPPKALLQQAIDDAQLQILKNDADGITLIFVVVVDGASNVEDTLRRIMSVADESSIQTIVRVYALSELQAKFELSN